MSLGGDFYALEQRHLAQILAGELDFFEFYEKTYRAGRAQSRVQRR